MFITRQPRAILMDDIMWNLPSKGMLKSIEGRGMSSIQHTDVTVKDRQLADIRQFDLSQLGDSRYQSSVTLAEQKHEKIVRLDMTMLQNVVDSIVERKLQSMGVSGTQDSSDPMRSSSAAMLESIAKYFDDMDFVRQLCYLDVDDELKLIIIHENEDFAHAFDTIFDRVLKLEELLSVYIEPLILHESEVKPRHLANAKTVFKK